MMKSAPFQTPTDMIDVGHSRLAYWRLGRGPDLLFVHGWPLHSATFRHLLPRLSDRFTCHLLDLPGAGETESDRNTPVGLKEHADTLATAVDRIGLERYALLAHDSGAAIARLLAAEHGPRVRGLVIGNSEIPGHRPWQVEVYRLLAHLPLGEALLGTFLTAGPLRRSPLALGACFTDPRFGDGEFKDLFVTPLVRSKRRLAGQMRLVYGLDWSVVDALEAVHRRITAPVLLIWGEHDPFFPLEKAKRMTPQFPAGAELVVIEGAKLFAHEDHPETFASHARPFLERCFEEDATATSAAPERTLAVTASAEHRPA